MERVHERYLKKLRRRQDAFLALKAYVPRAQALLRGMAEVVDMLLAEDVKDVVDSLFQSRRWKVLNSYIVARGVFVLYRLRLATSRGRYPSSRSARGRSRPVPSGYGPENNWARDDSPEEMQREAKIHRELWELDRSRDLFLQHQSKEDRCYSEHPGEKHTETRPISKRTYAAAAATACGESAHLEPSGLVDVGRSGWLPINEQQIRWADDFRPGWSERLLLRRRDYSAKVPDDFTNQPPLPRTAFKKVMRIELEKNGLDALSQECM
ncbi:hypothetical protein PG999_008369 [Apiospora kogelbergensis]|uniref:Uncharacterized protein n=1 Tax=Apiospora kogelbergensis TaxID=1337665 RepID=A0AAW0QLK6_9PEZI